MPESTTGVESRALGAYVEAVASSTPTPGGGSVAAVVGALAAALGEMVANLTVGRPAYATGEAELRAALARLGDARRRLLSLAADDERAYGGYVAAAALPKGTAEEKAARSAAMQTALLRSAEVPLACASTLTDLFADLERVARLGNRHVLSDAEIAAILAEASVRAAAVNARVNARLLRDSRRGEDLLARAAAAEATATAGLAAVRVRLEDRAQTG